MLANSSRLAAALMALSASVTILACAPNIPGNKFFCGPEGQCPPGQSCDYSLAAEFEYNCVLSPSASALQCSVTPTDREPDNTPDQALSLGVLSCTSRIEFPDFGCITDNNDVDHFSFSKNMSCGGDAPKVEIGLQFPIGAAPISAELLDSTGTAVATAEYCSTETEADIGLEKRCISVPDLAQGDYTIRIAMDSEGNASCDGECEFNRYKLVLSARSR